MSRDDFFSVPRRFPGETIFILAGGPSLAGQPIGKISARPTIAVNLSYSVAPWATYVYAQDARFLRRHRLQLEKRFFGRAVTISRHEAWPGLLTCRKREPSDGLAMKSSDLAGRRTSLAGAINLAAHLTGPGGRIVLLGADGGRAPDGRSHHHAAHPWPVKDENWQGQHDDLVPLKAGLESMGIAVTNCSPGSHWPDLWPIMSLMEFLASESDMTAQDWKRGEFQSAFDQERQRVYPMIDDLVARLGVRDFDTHPLGMCSAIARILACPVKVNPPNWQHGRVLYALARRRALAWSAGDEPLLFLDIGTAKGFSALCMLWALALGGIVRGEVHSLDVVDPLARVARNSVAELDGLLTVPEFVRPWTPPLEGRLHLEFHQKPGMFFDEVIPAGRIHLAFVDGKHKHTDVLAEARKIGKRQGPGDVILFDDAQMMPVRAAIDVFLSEQRSAYLEETIIVNDHRSYVLATRK